MLNIYESSTTKVVLDRLEKLKPDTRPLWGKMNPSQMLAHLNVVYDISLGYKKSTYSPIMKFLLKTLVKKTVVNDKPYKKKSKTPANFIISDERVFEVEKAKLISHVKDTENRGSVFFEGKESPSLGRLTAKEWSNLFYKHLDHHFNQFDI